jgi:hypothetical protein
MKVFARAQFAILAGGMISACGGSSTGGGACNTASSFYSHVQGTWALCTTSGTSSSRRNTILVSGCDLPSVKTEVFGTTDCTGAATVTATGTGSFIVGADMGLTPQTCGGLLYPTSVDVVGTGTPPGGSGQTTTLYTIAYIHPAISLGGPYSTLYFGDTSGANDGSTPAKRPTTIACDPVWRKQ